VLESQGLAAATVRRKLTAVSSLLQYLCNENAVEANPAAGVKRPGEGANEGKTSALSDPPSARRTATTGRVHCSRAVWASSSSMR